ncbi:MAG: hypothetical protein AB8G86_16850 [Saprospiraceae bacterium]
MKFLKAVSAFIFTLLFFLLLNSCTEPIATLTPEPEMDDDAIARFFTEYEGVASMSADLSSVVISSSDQPDRDGLIELYWSQGEHIYFVSQKFEFDVFDCTIWGADSCAQFAYNVKEDNEDKEDRHWIYFEPEDAFWRCLEAESCDPGDEVLCFHLMAREKS